MPKTVLNVSNSAKWKLVYHVVFVTKYRRPAMTNAILCGMEKVITGELTQSKSALIEFSGEADHIHILAEIPPSQRLSDVVQKLKIQTSRYARGQHWWHVKKYLWGSHFWSPSYCIVSAGGAPISVIEEYIRGQERPD